MRDGVSASRTWLPKCGSFKNANENHGHWETILDFLLERFPYIPETVFQERLGRGDIVDQTGKPYAVNSLYQPETFLFYYREIPDEPVIPFQETILFRDEHIIVVDKPHFLPVVPSGRFVRESLLSRLKHRFQMEDISPIHRLDRETAGVVVFSCNKADRGVYQSLFQNKQVSKTYEAIAARSTLEFPFNHRSRISKGEPFFRMQEEDGEVNTETIIDMVEVKGDLARYQLNPVTGKQHQLRVHMASIGSPILNDPFYPVLQTDKGEDYSEPLQLLAKTIEFLDPVTKELRSFESQQTLIF